MTMIINFLGTSSKGKGDQQHFFMVLKNWSHSSLQLEEKMWHKKFKKFLEACQSLF